MDLADAQHMARELMDEHGLTTWSLVFDRAKRRAGVCRAGEQTIGLSRPLTRVHTREQVRDTVLHEIAHALVGPRAGHGPRWQDAALAIGARPHRCLPDDAAKIPGSWQGTCPAGHTIDRHRRPSRVTACRECSATFDPSSIFAWTHHGASADPGPDYRRQLKAVLAAHEARRASPFGMPGGAAVLVGDRVRVTSPGRYHGFVGVVIKRGRTRFHVRGRSAVVTVPFALVEAD